MAPLTADDTEDGQSAKQQETRNLVIPFQNEYLAAALVDGQDPRGKEQMLCTAPDLIAMPAHPLWTGTELGVRVGGPEFFHLGVEFKSIGEYKLPRSVIDEFGT